MATPRCCRSSSPAAPPEGPFQLGLPIRARAFHDGLYINAAKEEGAPLTGTRLTRIGRMDVSTLIRASPNNGQATTPGRIAGPACTFRPSQRCLRASARSAIRTRRCASKRCADASASARRCGPAQAPRTASRHAAYASPREMGSGRQRRQLRPPRGSRDLHQLQSRWKTSTANLRGFTRACFAAMDNRPRSADLRRAPQWRRRQLLPEPLRKHILRSRFNRPGGLYVMTSPMTFSAAQNPTSRSNATASRSSWATPPAARQTTMATLASCKARPPASPRWCRPCPGSIPTRWIAAPGLCPTCLCRRPSRTTGRGRSRARHLR